MDRETACVNVSDDVTGTSKNREILYIIFVVHCATTLSSLFPCTEKIELLRLC